jgi:hypothetical protein
MDVQTLMALVIVSGAAAVLAYRIFVAAKRTFLQMVMLRRYVARVVAVPREVFPRRVVVSRRWCW